MYQVTVALDGEKVEQFEAEQIMTGLESVTRRLSPVGNRGRVEATPNGGELWVITGGNRFRPKEYLVLFEPVSE